MSLTDTIRCWALASLENVSVMVPYDFEKNSSLFNGTIGGATTFASAKVNNAIGKIGIFSLSLSLPMSHTYTMYTGNI